VDGVVFAETVVPIGDGVALRQAYLEITTRVRAHENYLIAERGKIPSRILDWGSVLPRVERMG